MERRVFICGERVFLAERVQAELGVVYDSWHDEVVILGYNWVYGGSFREFCDQGFQNSRWESMIIRKADGRAIGRVGLSKGLPDLSITVFAPYRGGGYGAEAFALAAQYCFRALKLDRLYAGCFEGNPHSLSMLKKCGFQRHPAGDAMERHVRSGEDRMQYDFVLERPSAQRQP